METNRSLIQALPETSKKVAEANSSQFPEEKMDISNRSNIAKVRGALTQDFYFQKESVHKQSELRNASMIFISSWKLLVVCSH